MNLETLNSITHYLATTKVQPFDRVDVEKQVTGEVYVFVECESKNMPQLAHKCDSAGSLRSMTLVRTGCPEIVIYFVDSGVRS